METFRQHAVRSFVVHLPWGSRLQSQISAVSVIGKCGTPRGCTWYNLYVFPKRHWPVKSKRVAAAGAPAEQVWRASVVLRGWVNYFCVGNSPQVFQHLRWYVEEKVRRALQRKAGCSGFGGSGMTALICTTDSVSPVRTGCAISYRPSDFPQESRVRENLIHGTKRARWKRGRVVTAPVCYSRRTEDRPARVSPGAERSSLTPGTARHRTA